jgi:hypothetical protein
MLGKSACSPLTFLYVSAKNQNLVMSVLAFSTAMGRFCFLGVRVWVSWLSSRHSTLPSAHPQTEELLSSPFLIPISSLLCLKAVEEGVKHLVVGVSRNS